MTNPNEHTCPKCQAPIAEGAPQGLCPKCVLSNAVTLSDSTGGARRKTPPPSIGELSLHFPQLEILELVDCGGMGAVYRARQTRLDRIVALKILAHDLHEDPSFAERFNREGRVLARLNHPNIVAVYDTGTAGPYAYLLMEFVDGVNLRQAMRTGGFTPKEALTIVGDICSALKFAHEEGILHRDIKPENVLIDSRGQVKIADFGIAKLIGKTESSDVTLTLDGAILGSPQYMAPEQIESPGDVDQRADIYSLGVVLYEMLTGELPLGRWALPSEKAAIDARIDEIVLRTLAKEREARYQTAYEVKTRVDAIQDTPAPAKSVVPAPPREMDWLKEWSKLLFYLSLVPMGIFVFFDEGMNGDTEIDVDAVDRFPFYLGATLFLSTMSGILSAIHRVKDLTLGEVAVPVTSDRSKHATRSAIFTAVSLSLALAAGIALPFLAKDMFLPGANPSAAEQAELSSELIAPGLVLGSELLIVCVTGILGIIFGVKALREIRRSGGRKGGIGSAAFGTFTWPALVTACLATALFTGFRPSIALLGKADSPSAEESKTAWRQGQPELELDLTVESGLVATIEFVRTDDSGEEQKVPGHLDSPGAYVIAPDEMAWQGTIEFGSLAGAPVAHGPRWLLGIGGSSVDFSHVGDWDFESEVPRKLDVSSPGIHRFQVATGESDRDLSGNLVLQVTGVKRTIPGIPAELMDEHTQEGSVVWIGSASQIDWIGRVRQALEERPQNAPEPATLAEGPKIDLDLTVAPGLMATFKLVETNAVGREKVLDAHRGFILSSDTVPWSGTVLLAAVSYPSKIPPSPETGREMLSSIRSSSGNIKELNNGQVSNFAYEWDWETAKALDLNLSKAGQHDFEVAGRSDLSQTLTLRVNVQPRRVPGVPSVALNQIPMDRAVCGLGGDIEWIRHLMEALEEKMKASEAPLPPREPEPEWREGNPKVTSISPSIPVWSPKSNFTPPARTERERSSIVAISLPPIWSPGREN